MTQRPHTQECLDIGDKLGKATDAKEDIARAMEKIGEALEEQYKDAKEILTDFHNAPGQCIPGYTEEVKAQVVDSLAQLKSRREAFDKRIVEWIAAVEEEEKHNKVFMDVLDRCPGCLDNSPFPDRREKG